MVGDRVLPVFGCAGVIAVGHSVWLGLLGWGACADLVRGIVVTRYADWRGLVWYRAAISGSYVVRCWFFAITNDSGGFPCLHWGGVCQYPFSRYIRLLGSLPPAVSESRGLLLNLLCSIFDYGDVLLWGLVEDNRYL